MRPCEILRCDADDGEDGAVHANCSSKDRTVARELAIPHVITDDRRQIPARDAVFIGAEPAPEHRLGAAVGTANFDNRSFALSEETNVCFHDGALVDQLHGIFVADLARCEKIELSEWRRRGLRQRTKERLE